jgi:hypothetical protein
MDENEKLNVVADVHRKLVVQVKRMLVFMAEEFKGMEIEIVHFKNSGMSFMKSFLPGKHVWINIEVECSEITEMKQCFTITVFSLFDNEFEIVFHVNEGSELFSLIPPEIVMGLRTSFEFKRNVNVKLGEKPS